MRMSDWSSDVCSSYLYCEKEPSEFSKLLVGLLGPDEDESAAAAPRGWFGLAAMKRELTERRLIQDLSLLTRAGSVQAACLDCRAYRPTIPQPQDAAAKGWLAALAPDRKSTRLNSSH